MSARRRRGHVLGLVMAALTALSALGGVLWARAQSAVEATRAEDLRVQALWLARSAARTGFSGAAQVELGRGRARVTSQVKAVVGGLSVHAEVAVPTGIAKVDAVLDSRKRPVSWSERFEASARRERARPRDPR